MKGKSKILFALCFAFVLAVAAFGLTACGQSSGSSSGGDNSGGGTTNPPGHTHTMTHYSAKAPGCTESGNVEYWRCRDCKKQFSDSKGVTEIKNVSLSATGHTYSPKWSYNDEYHWHAATCKHTSELKDKQAHALNNGACNCGYKIEGTEGLIYAPFRTGYAVTGYEGTATKVIVPAAYEGKPVLAIGTGTGDGFAYSASVTEIVLPNTIQQIQAQAFSYCTKLQKIEIPSCLNMGDGAFMNCLALTEITLPENCISYGNSLFYGCAALAELTVRGGRITANMLRGCSSLIAAVFGEDVIAIDPLALTYCTKLETLTVARLDGPAYQLFESGTYTIEDAENMLPQSVEGKSRVIGGTTVRWQCPKPDSLWTYGKSSATVNGRYAVLNGDDCKITSWSTYNYYYGSTKVDSWQIPSRATCACYFIPQTLKKVTVTNQQLSLQDEKLANLECELEILNRFPVTKIELEGSSESYIDEYELDSARVKITRSSGEQEYVPLCDVISAADANKFTTVGEHTLTATFGGFTAKLKVILRNHTFDNAEMQSTEFYYDGTAKSLEVSGAPSGTDIKYSGNGQTAVGVYTVTATLTKQYYEPKTITATLTVMQNEYKITYVLGFPNAENPNPATYLATDGIEFVEPAHCNKIFIGWFADPEYKTKITRIPADTRENKIVYAKWETIFTVNGNTVTGLTPKGKENIEKYPDLVIDSEINGVKITAIADKAFYVTPDVSRPSKLSRITSITIPEGVKHIGKNAFVTGDSYYSSRLETVYIPSSVVSIGENAFYHSIKKVYITDIAAWCGIDFANQEANPLSYAKNLYINEVLITDLEIPDSVTSIGDYAFNNCSKLTSITVPNSVTSIGNSTFYNCRNLMRVTIGNGVTRIGMYAFKNCSRLTSVTIPDSVTSIDLGSFYWCSSLTSITIPDSVTSIGDRAFSDCSNLTSIEIPDSVTSIGYRAFSDCSSLTSIIIPNSVTSIGGYAFAGCSSLTSVTIPDSVTSIGNYAFAGCSSLTSITIPDSVTSIGGSAFSDCSKITIYCEAEREPSGWYSSWNISGRPVVWGYKG